MRKRCPCLRTANPPLKIRHRLLTTFGIAAIMRALREAPGGGLGQDSPFESPLAEQTVSIGAFTVQHLQRADPACPASN